MPDKSVHLVMRMLAVMAAILGLGSSLLLVPSGSFGQTLAELESQLEELTAKEDALVMDLQEVREAMAEVKAKISMREFEIVTDKGMFVEATVTARADVYSEPDFTSKTVGTIPAGGTVKVTGYVGADYYRVVYGDLAGYTLDWFDRSAESVERGLALLKAADKEKREKEEEEEAARQREDARRRKREREESLVRAYGREIADRILRQQYWLGMTSDMARESLGRPSDINRTVSGSGEREQWVYSRYDLYLYFENGVLTTWQD